MYTRAALTLARHPFGSWSSRPSPESLTGTHLCRAQAGDRDRVAAPPSSPKCGSPSRKRLLQRALPAALQDSVKLQSGGTELLNTLAQVSSFFLAVRPGSSESPSPPPTSVPTYWSSLASLWHGGAFPTLRFLSSDGSPAVEVHPSSMDVPQSGPGRGLDGVVTASDIQSLQGLQAWLGERLPSGMATLEAWGTQQGTKCLGNLWTELVMGEACLFDTTPPRRGVNVVSVRVKHPKTQRFLVEARQQMRDGSMRVRNRPLSEKMQPGESVEEACLRGVLEELGPELGHPSRVSLVRDSFCTEVQDRDSVSYPGLPSRYTIHTVVAFVDGLPETPFSTVEGEGGPPHLLEGAVAEPIACSCPPSQQCRCKEQARVLNEEISGVQVHFWDWVDQLPVQGKPLCKSG